MRIKKITHVKKIYAHKYIYVNLLNFGKHCSYLTIE